MIIHNNSVGGEEVKAASCFELRTFSQEPGAWEAGLILQRSIVGHTTAQVSQRETGMVSPNNPKIALLCIALTLPSKKFKERV